MNKKGFTLVELLAVIVVIAILLIIVSTSGFGVFNKAKDKLLEENINSIKEGVNILITEVDSCDDDIDASLINEYAPSNNKTCEGLQTKFDNSNDIEITLKYLIDNNYISGESIEKLSDNNPNATIIIKNKKFDSIINLDNKEI